MLHTQVSANISDVQCGCIISGTMLEHVTTPACNITQIVFHLPVLAIFYDFYVYVKYNNGCIYSICKY